MKSRDNFRTIANVSRVSAAVGLGLSFAGLVWMFLVPRVEVRGDTVLSGVPNWDGIWLVAAGLFVVLVGLGVRAISRLQSSAPSPGEIRR